MNIPARRILLELWAMLVLACIVGFMGPFGTYGHEGLVDRTVHWWNLLMGAYLLVRPAITALMRLAKATELPHRATVFWGVVVISLPLGLLWRQIGKDTFRELDGYTGLLPFSLLCALAVLAVTDWARTADLRLARRRARPPRRDAETIADKPPTGPAGESLESPPLRALLSPSFRGPILALQSEDHYVRVHGEKDGELLLMRLRDAIAQMHGVNGAQVHRSWWVAQEAMASVERSGRNWGIVLKNGTVAPVARDTVPRLQASGLLPGTLPDEEPKAISPD